jgi:hypothetical protein
MTQIMPVKRFMVQAPCLKERVGPGAFLITRALPFKIVKSHTLKDLGHIFSRMPPYYEPAVSNLDP